MAGGDRHLLLDLSRRSCNRLGVNIASERSLVAGDRAHVQPAVGLGDAAGNFDSCGGGLAATVSAPFGRDSALGARTGHGVLPPLEPMATELLRRFPGARPDL